MSTSLGASEHVSAMSYKITLPLDRAGSITLQIAFKQNDTDVGEMRCDAPRSPSQAPSDPALTIEVNRHTAVFNPQRPPLSTTSRPAAGTSHPAPPCTILTSPSHHRGVHHMNVPPEPRDSEPPPTNHEHETQWSEISPSNIAVINSFVGMFDECPGRPKSPQRPFLPALHRPSSPSPHQLPESQLPLAGTQLLEYASPSASRHQPESDSGSETEPELDPIYDAYCLGYSDGHRRAAGGGEGGSGRCSSKHLASCTCEDSTLVEDEDDEHPRTYVPIPSTNAGCHLTPRTRKRITADLPQSPVTRAAVKRFKTTHGALITAREAAKHQRV